MYKPPTISLTRKFLYGLMLLTIFISAFKDGSFSEAQAQARPSILNSIQKPISKTNDLENVNVNKDGEARVQTGGSHTITYFKDNKAGAVSFTFDDGYASQLNTAIPVLDQRGVKGTFFVITGRETPTTWAAWRNAVAEGHEVASHTVTHRDLTTLSDGEVASELSDSQFAISQNVPGQVCASISYPLTFSNPTVLTTAAAYYAAGRAGWVTPNRFLNYYQAGSDQNGGWTAINFFTIASMNADTLSDPSQFQMFDESLNFAVSRHAWMNLHFHDVTDAVAFAGTVDYIQSKSVYWIDTFCNVSRYMKERLNSTVQVVTDNSSEIRLNVVMSALPATATYNFPLTLRSTVPAAWTGVNFQQGATAQLLVPVTEGSVKVVYYNAIPNGGEVRLTNSAPVLTSLSPSSTVMGNSAFTLTVNGSNFMNGSTVRWNGTDRTTTYVNSTQLTASISAADIAGIGTANVTVTNPIPSGDTSGQLPFVINPPSAPAAFGKTSPANAATNQSLSATLSWAASAGAASYEYCYDTINDNACSNWTSNGSSTSKSLSGLATTTTYYWQVRAVNPGGTTYGDGSGTAFWSFTTVPNPPSAFTKTSPGSGATDQPIGLTLSWTASANATSYEYCYDTTNDNACSSWVSNGSSTSTALSSLNTGTTYYWQVRAVNAGGPTYADGALATFWSFTTVPNAPAAFAKTSPTNGAIDQSPNLTLSWAASAGAASYEYCYDISNDSACSSWISNGTSTSTALSGLSAGTTYYWQVRAVNVGGTTYADGIASYRSFTTLPNPPSAFSKTNPTDGATDQPLNATLSWASSAGATSYEYCYDTSNDNACSSWTNNGASTSKALSGLATSTTYYWQARAVNNGGTTYADGSSSVSGSFTTVPNPPAAFAKTSPANGAINQTASPTLSWAASAGAASYEYCYDTSNDSACSGWINNGISTSKALSGLSAGVTYYWQVRAVNAGGVTYATNSTSFWSFTLTCYTLTKSVLVAASGSVNASPAPNCNNGTQYGYGTTVTLTAVPASGYAFMIWSGDVSGSSTSVNLVMTTNKTATAAFGSFTSTLSAPTLQSPQTNMITLNNKPTFLWTSVTGGQQYEIAFASDSAFVNGVGNKIVAGTSYTAVSAFVDGKYYWRVRAYNVSNQFGVWSTTRIFTIDTTGPSVPVLSSPLNNSLVRGTPTFKWQSSNTAVNYEFQYDNNVTFSSPEYTSSRRTNYCSPSAMKVGVYYWRVRAQDATGNWSTWSSPFTITITGP